MTAAAVSVVGTVNHDVIVTPDGHRHESLGGILYNALPLAALLEGRGIRVRVHGRLGSGHRREIERMSGAFPALDLDGLISDPAGTNGSLLDYTGPGDRREEVEMRVAPLSIDDLAGVPAARVVLVNMISGRDISPGTIAELRDRSSATFLLDIQALARSGDSPRRPRRVPDWGEWSRLFDVVRGNEEEVAFFGDRPGDPPAAARAILAAGAARVLVTRGEKGARIFESGGEREEWGRDVPARPAPRAVDPTGCGDSFLAGVAAGIVLGAPFVEAVNLGTWVASEVVGLVGLTDLSRLTGVLDRAREGLPSLRAAIGPPERST